MCLNAAGAGNNNSSWKALSSQSDHAALWEQALECCAAVGESAGADLFRTDALSLMELMMARRAAIAQSASSLIPRQSNTEVSEPPPESSSLGGIGVMKTWVTIARCLQQEILPYVTMIMRDLFTCMAQDVTVPSEEVDAEDEQSDLELIETNDGWVAVRCSAVEVRIQQI